jgi:hypothetical protein
MLVLQLNRNVEGLCDLDVGSLISSSRAFEDDRANRKLVGCLEPESQCEVKRMFRRRRTSELH